MDSFVIRNAKPGDGLGIATVQVQTWRDAYAGIVDQTVLDSLSIEEAGIRTEERIAESSFIRLVATVGDTIVGFAVYGWKPEKPFECEWFLFALYVLPEYQGVGIGRGLLDRVKAFGREAGAARLVFGVLSANEPSKEFYRRQGAVFVANHGYPIGGMMYPTDYCEIVLR
ncbi:MAG: GNAT family N-acetyltransferase [Armatimonadetes bacterium]|nr:GNAT family N-acetyltransferase [Armatimonadota bacterium]